MVSFRSRQIRQDHQFTPWYQLYRQPLAALIRMPWPLFFTAMACIYLAQILGFGFLLSFDRKSLHGEPPMGLPKAFVFAAEAFFANALNGIEPISEYTYSLGILAMIAGLITLSTVTAVVFSKLSTHEMPLVFGRFLCITKIDDGCMYCRFVTSDQSQWLNVSYSLTLIYDDESEPGVWQRRTCCLALLNSRTPQLSQTATLTHRLDHSSPIRQIGIDELSRRHAVIMPLVEGIDESTGSGLLQTHLYRLEDVVIGMRFSDLVSQDATGRRRVNLNLLNSMDAVS